MKPDLPETGDFEERDPDSETIRMQVRFEEGLPHGTWKHFRRDGTQTWEEERVDGVEEGPARGFHPDGSVSQQGAYSGGEWHGPRQWFRPDGSIKTEGSYEHGVRHGTWRWLGPNGNPTTVIRFVANAREGEERPHERIEYLRCHPNGNKKLERVDREDGGWLKKTYYEDGTLESEMPYAPGGSIFGYRDMTFAWAGIRHGLAREFHPDGSPKTEETFERHIRVGERVTWSEDGKKSVTIYESGAAAVPEAKLAKLAAKLLKKKESYGMRDALERAKIEWGEHSGVVWQMFRRGLLTANDADIWRLVEADGGTPADGVRLVSQLPDSRKPFSDAWGDELDTLILDLASRDPELFERALPELSRRAQRGVKLVLARLGRNIDGKDNRYFLGQFAKREVEGELDCLPMPCDDFIDQHADLRDKKGRPTPRLYEVIETFTTRAKWAAAVRKARTKAEYPSSARIDHFEGITARDELRDWLDFLDPSHIGADALAVLESRDDEVDDLLWLADNCETPAACAAASVIAISRGAASWPSVEPAGFAALPAKSLAAALQHKPNDELAKGLIAAETPNAIAAVCSLAGQPTLWRAALEQVAQRSDIDAAMASAAATVGGEGLELLVETLDAHPGAQTLRLAALQTMASMAETGTDWSPQHDALLEGIATEDKALRKTVDACLRTATSALPRDRQTAVAQRVVADERETWFHGLAVLGRRPAGSVLSAFFERLARTELDEPMKQAVSAALDGLDDRWQPFVRWALRSELSDSFLALLRERYAEKNELTQDFEALAPQTPTEDSQAELEPEPEPDKIEQLVALLDQDSSTERTPIFAPRFVDERPPAGAPGSFNQVGGVPPGFTAESWPTLQDDDDDDPEPMDFLFMVDLATTPELAAQYPGKRAMAMFISSAGHNEAYEPDNGECELVFLDESQLAQPALAEGPGTPIEARHYQLVRLEVPVSAFGGSGPIQSLVWQLPARFLGEPTWIQDEAHWGELILQFDESFVPMNLGDCGIMYVFDDAQFWQCS